MAKLGYWERRRRRSVWRRRRQAAKRIFIAFLVGAAIGVAILPGDGPLSLNAWLPASIGSDFGICSTFRRDNCVVDGDTIRFEGQRVRLVGVDAPELSPPRCAAERERGIAAKHRLFELLNQGPVEFRHTAARYRDQYDRQLLSARVGGRDIGEVLIAEGLARPYRGSGRQSWC